MIGKLHQQSREQGEPSLIKLKQLEQEVSELQQPDSISAQAKLD